MNVSHGAVLDHKRPSCYIVSMMIHPVFEIPRSSGLCDKTSWNQSIKHKKQPSTQESDSQEQQHNSVYADLESVRLVKFEC